MITIAIRVREIVSSNVDTLVSKAGEPRKMLRLLQSEIEETLIALHGEAAKARRQQARLSDAAARLAEGAESWTDKAKVALDHGREDLARAALLTREAERGKAVDAVKAAAELETQIADAAGVIADLEAKRAAITARMAEMAQAEQAAVKAAAPAADSALDRRIDRIDALERRAGFADTPAETPSSVSIEEEIAALQQASAIEAELAALKAAAAPAPAKKASGKKG